MPTPLHFGLPSPIHSLRVERSRDDDGWCLWLMANKDFTYGTYILLSDSGDINRITLHPDGSESIFNVIGD